LQASPDGTLVYRHDAENEQGQLTAHEHLPRFGLINMNARLYNPLLGRFLSPDPYVQLPDCTMGLNRYGME
jgi:RHS repeat-associated protein